jgi:hypothetical protein
MTAMALLHEVNSLGVELHSDGTDLILRPSGKTPPELKERLKAVKAELIAILRTRPETCAPTCYEIEPCRWVHHPWNGCRTRPGRRDVTSEIVRSSSGDPRQGDEEDGSECEECPEPVVQ